MPSVAHDIIRWMDEWLSDRERGGFYASQDADISMDDDGDYFTWTLEETRAVLTEEEAQVAALHYDINEIGEMHHNPAKNVLYVRAPIDEIARRMNLSSERVQRAAGFCEEKNVCRAPAAANALCGQDGLCGMEQHVRIGLSGSGKGARSDLTPAVLPCDPWTGFSPKLGSIQHAKVSTVHPRTRASCT